MGPSVVEKSVLERVSYLVGWTGTYSAAWRVDQMVAE